MSTARKGAGLLSRRYAFMKFYTAAEEVVHQIMHTPSSSLGGASATAISSQGSVLSRAVAKFREIYTKPLTTKMYITGSAMSPCLNRRASKDPEAVEKLIIRLLPRPSQRSVWVGDVVALTSPLGNASDPAQVMVRRVAAVEGMEMVSENTDDENFQIPLGHCWVLADNPDMAPPHVIDSRTFGFVPMSNIIGRVIYSGSSVSDHAPVTNSPMAQMVDDPVLENEVVVDELFESSGSEGGSSSPSQEEEGEGESGKRK